jgi:hypothetical protein
MNPKHTQHKHHNSTTCAKDLSLKELTNPYESETRLILIVTIKQ